MTETADAIIIGTGVIGSAIAYELAKAGWKTLSLDRNSQIGHGSTAGSCAIVRMHYSTLAFDQRQTEAGRQVHHARMNAGSTGSEGPRYRPC